MRQADWFFDYISPYACLQFHQLRLFPRTSSDLAPGVVRRLAELTGPAWPGRDSGQKGPYLCALPMAGTGPRPPLHAPPRHPFNPLTLLRLTLALGSTPAVVRAIFDHLWAQGGDGQDPAALKALAANLGVDDLAAATGAQTVKEIPQLRQNTEEAVAAGVYGAPSFVIEDHLFWGDDMFEMLCAWLDNPTLLDQSRGLPDQRPAARRRTQTPMLYGGREAQGLGLKFQQRADMAKGGTGMSRRSANSKTVPTNGSISSGRPASIS